MTTLEAILHHSEEIKWTKFHYALYDSRISRRALSLISGVPAKTISLLEEKADGTTEQYEKLARALRCNINDIIN